MNSAENVSDERLSDTALKLLIEDAEYAQFEPVISALRELQSLRSPPTEDADRVEVAGWPPLVDLGRVLGFFASVIKSGEPWTETCQVEYQKANVALQALYASPRPETVGVSAHEQFRLEWLAAARPPHHPEPMKGRQTFETFEQAVRFMQRQPADAQFVSLEQISSYSRDRSDDARAALSPQEDEPLRERLARITEHRATLSPEEYPEEQPNPLSPQEGE